MTATRLPRMIERSQSRSWNAGSGGAIWSVMSTDLSPSDVVRFWKDAGPSKWFAKDDAFDALFRERFEHGHMTAARRALDHWAETPEGSLALLILLDQFPRNAFRGTAHQFATDGLGLMFARRAFELGWPGTFEPDLRQFFMTPFEHSEDLADHDDLIPLIGELPEVEKFAVIHRDIIMRFGRFPHRNKVLGRQTSAAEQAFLDQGGFSG